MMALEPAATHYAAPRRTMAQLKELFDATVRFARSAQDTSAAVAAVLDFFTPVAGAADNHVPALSQAPLNALLTPTLTSLLESVPQAHSRIVHAQGRISAAIEAQHSDSARLWMEKHIRDLKRGYELQSERKNDETDFSGRRSRPIVSRGAVL
jgi:GntR family transcriptional repressor for pyruvate dehydrogenase complex